MPFWGSSLPSDAYTPPGPACDHARLDIDRTLCPCGFRHVYCVTCETRMDTDPCPWIPDTEAFRVTMQRMWTMPADEALD